MKVIISDSEQQTEEIAQELAASLPQGSVIAYRGGLGAGKTAFTRGLAKGLGLNVDEVSSPTFALVQEYQNDFVTLYHFDMYRILDYDSLYSIGFFDYLDQKSYLAIEWSENITEFLPDNTITITINPISDTLREIIIEGMEEE